jgi:hypothetical protein
MRIGTRVVLLDSQKEAVGSAAEWHGQLGKVVQRAASGRKNQYRGFYWVETEGRVSVIVHLNDIWIDTPSSHPLAALLAAKVKEMKERRINTTFKPTHRIATDRETVDVMLIDGAAYQQCEHEATDAADYERDEDGRWLFQGRPFTGTVERIYKIAFMLESTGGFEVVETFSASGNYAANHYAKTNYDGQQWYVLNAEGENINA